MTDGYDAVPLGRGIRLTVSKLFKQDIEQSA